MALILSVVYLNPSRYRSLYFEQGGKRAAIDEKVGGLSSEEEEDIE
jgi:hypothetical protein